MLVKNNIVRSDPLGIKTKTIYQMPLWIILIRKNTYIACVLFRHRRKFKSRSPPPRAQLGRFPQNANRCTSIPIIEEQRYIWIEFLEKNRILFVQYAPIELKESCNRNRTNTVPVNRLDKRQPGQIRQWPVRNAAPNYYWQNTLDLGWGFHNILCILVGRHVLWRRIYLVE